MGVAMELLRIFMAIGRNKENNNEDPPVNQHFVDFKSSLAATLDCAQLDTIVYSKRKNPDKNTEMLLGELAKKLRDFC